MVNVHVGTKFKTYFGISNSKSLIKTCGIKKVEATQMQMCYGVWK